LTLSFFFDNFDVNGLQQHEHSGKKLFLSYQGWGFKPCWCCWHHEKEKKRERKHKINFLTKFYKNNWIPFFTFLFFLNFFVIKTAWSSSSTVVKYLPLHQTVGGLSLATAAGIGERKEKRKKDMKKEFIV
jgi:hypothetical protein